MKSSLNPLQEIQRLLLLQREPKQLLDSRKVQENAEGSASSKPNLMRDSDALLTLLEKIIHGDPDCWGILLKNSMAKVLFNCLLGPAGQLAYSTATPRQRRANAGAAHRILRRRIRRILRHRIS